MSYRSRSVAIVVRNGKILMERLCYPDTNNGKEFFSVPGGGIEEGETPEEQIRILDNSQDMGFELLDTLFPDNPEIRKICAQSYRVLTNHKCLQSSDIKILIIADLKVKFIVPPKIKG